MKLTCSESKNLDFYLPGNVPTSNVKYTLLILDELHEFRFRLAALKPDLTVSRAEQAEICESKYIMANG